MSVASQLYQLQETDTELESAEKSVTQINRQLGDRGTVTEAEKTLASARRHLEELTKQQRSVENEIADLNSKLSLVEKDLYGGRVRNPKELTDLQHEAEGMKAHRAQLENQALELMEQVEQAASAVTGMESEFKRLESEWQSQQKQLAAGLEKLKTAIANLKQKRQTQVAGIDPQAVAVYQEVRKQRGTAVARIDQGLCKGCRVTLSVTEFQKARTGALVKCGNCGRILFLA